MSGSIFISCITYLRDVFSGARSILESCVAAIPYLFSAGENRKEVTEQYPDPISSRTADDLPSRSRGILFNDIDRCTGCRECEKICPNRSIFIETQSGSDPAKIWVSVFDIDLSKCVFCGLCVDVCVPESIVHTKQYEGAVYILDDLKASFGRGGVTPEMQARWAANRRANESEGGGF
ncbi:4Fe-4S binding protein [Bdellovibrionota bacterium FG-2]